MGKILPTDEDTLILWYQALKIHIFLEKVNWILLLFSVVKKLHNWNDITFCSSSRSITHQDLRLIFKVHIFWEGHKILRNLHLTFVLCRPVKSKVKISQNLAAFSEYMNFNYNHPHNISGPAEYTPLALLVIVRDGGKSEKLRVQKK